MPKRTPEYMAAQRERILDAALECFAEKGFHQTSTDDIARLAACGKSAIYAHFDTKRDIIEALSERELEHYGTNGPQDLPELERYVADSFEQLHTPRMRKYSRLTLHMAAESLTDRDHPDWEGRLFKRYLQWIVPLVRNDPAAARLSDRQVHDAARRLIFFWAGQALYKMLMPNLPVAMLHSDMAAVAPAIIESARRAPLKPSSRSPTGTRAAVKRRRPVPGRPSDDAKRSAVRTRR